MERIKRYVENNGNEGFTYKEIGIHYNTLGALVRRGYLSKEGSKYYLLPRGYIVACIKDNAGNREYFVLRDKQAIIGMMCSIKGNDILDCYDNIYDIKEEGLYFRYCEPNSEEIEIKM